MKKRYIVPFPLAVLSAALHPANTLPCGTAKGYFCIVQGGRAEPAKHKERTYPTNENTRQDWSVHSKTE